MARTQLLYPIAAGLVDCLRVDDQRERIHGPVVEQECHLQTKRTQASQLFVNQFEDPGSEGKIPRKMGKKKYLRLMATTGTP